MAKLKTMGVWLWRVLLGTVFVQSPILALLVIGWTYRYMQRRALKTWFEMRDNAAGALHFQDFAQKHAPFQTHELLPNWILEQRPIDTIKARAQSPLGLIKKVHGIARCVYASAKKNLLLGIQGYANIMVVTLLPAVLWQFGWYSGWDNSFNKGYEQHDNGVFISLIGIVLFIGVMFYLPMAQARQAVTGNWRSFYQFGVIRQLVRIRPMSCLYLAGLYSLISVPLTFFKTLPLFIGNINPATETMSDPQLYDYMQRYFFNAGILFFVGYLILHRVAAKIYAKALIEALARNSVTINDLSPWEVEVLSRLSLVQSDPNKQTPIAIKVVKTVVRPAWKVGLTVATVLVWFSFVAQIYASEFLVYHPLQGWMNQPLVQAPWYNYTPSHLKPKPNQPRADSGPDMGGGY